MNARPSVEQLKNTCIDLKKNVITMIHKAKSGHPGGSLSAAEFVTACYFHEMNVDPANPKWEDRDRFILSKGHVCPAQYAALAIFVIASLTDLIDGKIARHFNMISTVGKILDPLADKATQFTLILCLSMKHTILLYLIALFVIKEGFQLIAGSINLRRGKMLKGALFSGKLCTTILFISLILMVMIPTLPETVIHVIATIDIIFMLISFIDYLITYSNRENWFQSLDEQI